MRISTLEKAVRPVTLALLPFLMLFLLHEPLLAQDRAGAQGRIERARWEMVGNEVVISYDLLADVGKVYDITVTLKRTSDERFGFVPGTVTGAVGRGVRAGLKKEIRWDYKKDVPQEFKGNDYFFEIVVNVSAEPDGTNLLYYVAGGVVVVAAIVAVLLSGKKTTPIIELPEPPSGRPPLQ